jgi:hypothetical protein
MSMIFHMVQMLAEQQLMAMPLEKVKALWDAYDGTNAPNGFSGEVIHLVLNKRGHGDYCAV